MYHDYFGLDDAPFRITPDTQLFFAGGKRGLILEALLYAVNSGEGIVKVVGEVGSGKTMLCRMLAEKLPEHVECVYLVNPRLTPDSILQAIALELALPVAGQGDANRLQVLHALHAALLQKHAAGRQVVVLIEEAQCMPLDTLEEIRLLSNLETGRHKLLQIVLFGQPELDDNLARASIRQLRERITHGFYLPPLPRREIAEYVDFRMRAVGYRGPWIFTPGALRALARYSKGLLRRVNILADKALLAAFADNAHAVRATHVRRAARDSRFPGAGGLPWGRLAAVAGLCGLLAVGGLGMWRERAWLPAGLEYAPRAAPAPPAVVERPDPPLPAEQAGAARADPLPDAPPVPPPSRDADAWPDTPLLRERLAATRAWLARAEDAHYSIQVLQRATDDPQDVERFLHQPELAPLLEALYVYRINETPGGTPAWGVLYATFPDLETARAAMRGLPRSLRRNQPFLRNVAGLREKLSRSQ